MLGNIAESILGLFDDIEKARAALSVLGIEASIVTGKDGNLILNRDQSYVIDLFKNLSENTLTGAKDKVKSLSLLEVEDEYERYRLINDQIQDAERSLENYERTANSHPPSLFRIRQRSGRLSKLF